MIKINNNKKIYIAGFFIFKPLFYQLKLLYAFM